MRLLLDTHLLLWVAQDSYKLSPAARRLIEDDDNALFFSAASMWEIAIKSSLKREDFKIDARVLRHGLITNGYSEIPIRSDHAVFVENLPPIHKDPFDRMLVAQAIIEATTLLTADTRLAECSGCVLKL